MKRIVSLAVAGVLLSFVPSQASAQDQTLPKGTPSSERMGTEYSSLFHSEALFGDPERAPATYAVAVGIARCMVGVSGNRVAELIGGPNTADERYRNLSRALQRHYSACMKVGSAMPPMIVNYGLAETLVLRDEMALEDRAMSVNVDEASAFQGSSDGPVTMDGLARCLTAYSPGLVRKVVVADSGSPEEAAALQALYAQTPECGISASPTSIPSVFQRGSLAVALYFWTHRGDA